MHLIRAEDLPAMDTDEGKEDSADPYVSSFVASSHISLYAGPRSHTISRSRKPTWNETLDVELKGGVISAAGEFTNSSVEDSLLVLEVKDADGGFVMNWLHRGSTAAAVLAFSCLAKMVYDRDPITYQTLCLVSGCISVVLNVIRASWRNNYVRLKFKALLDLVLPPDTIKIDFDDRIGFAHIELKALMSQREVHFSVDLVKDYKALVEAKQPGTNDEVSKDDIHAQIKALKCMAIPEERNKQADDEPKAPTLRQIDKMDATKHSSARIFRKHLSYQLDTEPEPEPKRGTLYFAARLIETT